MTPDFWKQIQPQLNSQIADVIGDAMPATELTFILYNGYYFWQQEPFASMKLHYENVDMSIHQWLNACEALTGKEVAEAFEDTMRKRIADTIEAQWTLRLNDLEEAYTAEMKEVAA